MVNTTGAPSRFSQTVIAILEVLTKIILRAAKFIYSVPSISTNDHRQKRNVRNKTFIAKRRSARI